MEKRVPVSPYSDHSKLVLHNSEQRLAPDVVQALSSRREVYFEQLALQNQNDLTPDIKKKMLDEKKGAYGAVAETMGLNFDKLTVGLQDITDERSAHTSAALKDRITAKTKFIGIDKQAPLPPTPEPVDHSFWWARTQPLVAPAMQTNFPDDGLHFFGGPKVNDYDGEMHTSFGAVASFAINPARFPTSASGMFLSSPHVELFGGIVAFAPDWDVIQGNGIASCELFLRQTIFQFGLGGTVPIAEAKGTDAWHIYLKNTGYSRHLDMPGFKLIPAVVYNQSQVVPTDLWAEIEVRFDIYLNCTGALAWCDPEVLLRTFQWAPTPLP